MMILELKSQLLTVAFPSCIEKSKLDFRLSEANVTSVFHSIFFRRQFTPRLKMTEISHIRALFLSAIACNRIDTPLIAHFFIPRPRKLNGTHKWLGESRVRGRVLVFHHHSDSLDFIFIRFFKLGRFFHDGVGFVHSICGLDFAQVNDRHCRNQPPWSFEEQNRRSTSF